MVLVRGFGRMWLTHQEQLQQQHQQKQQARDPMRGERRSEVGEFGGDDDTPCDCCVSIIAWRPFSLLQLRMFLFRKSLSVGGSLWNYKYSFMRLKGSVRGQEGGREGRGSGSWVASLSRDWWFCHVNAVPRHHTSRVTSAPINVAS